MAKKVVIEQADFEKLASYIMALPVQFQNAEKAVEIQAIFKRVKLMVCDVTPPETTNKEIVK